MECGIASAICISYHRNDDFYGTIHHCRYDLCGAVCEYGCAFFYQYRVPHYQHHGGTGYHDCNGGNAIVSRKMGAGKNQEAKEDFTLLIITGAVIGFLILLGGTIWIDNIIYALGASNLLFPYCKDYLMVLFLFIPANILQTLFSNLFVTAGKPGLGFGLSVLAGVANIILDYIFIVPCGLGIQGAALGTGFGYLIPTVTGLAYFARNKGTLSFTRPKLKLAVIGESCFNGSSEMVGQLATAVTTFLFNRTMMNLLGCTDCP